MRRSQYLVALDGMRGVAAVVALFHHIFIYSELNRTLIHNKTLCDHVYLLVDCFYIMSGFVIAHSFDRKMATGLSFRRFMELRVLRLYPMIIAGVALGSLTLLALWKITPEIGPMPIFWSIVSGILLLPTTALDHYRPYLFPANSPHWSLSFEMILCVVYAGTFRFLKARILVFTALLCGAWLAVTSFCTHGLDIGFMQGEYFLTAGRVTYPFLIGIMLRRSDLFRPDSQRWGYVGIPLLLVVLMNPVPVTWQYDTVVDLVVLPAIVWLIACAKPVALLDRWSALGGNLSYPLYAIHFPIVIAFANAAKAMHLSALGNGLMAAGCAIVTIVIASYSYIFYDVPVRAYLGSRLIGPRTGRDTQVLRPF